MRSVSHIGVYVAFLVGFTTLGHAASVPQAPQLEPVATNRIAPLALSSSSPASIQIPAPQGAIKFCATYGAECAAEAPARVALDEATKDILTRINTAVNARIQPQNDAPGTDSWDLGKAAGDCDDYAVQKRHELRKLGFPASALLLAAGQLSNGETHLVLLVVTDAGDYVLDNRSDEITPWNRKAIRWIARQSSSNPRHWLAMNSRSAPAMAPIEVATIRIPASPVFEPTNETASRMALAMTAVSPLLQPDWTP